MGGSLWAYEWLMQYLIDTSYLNLSFRNFLVTHVIVSSNGQTSDTVINKHLEVRNLEMWDMVISGAIP